MLFCSCVTIVAYRQRIFDTRLKTSARFSVINSAFLCELYNSDDMNDTVADWQLCSLLRDTFNYITFAARTCTCRNKFIHSMK